MKKRFLGAALLLHCLAAPAAPPPGPATPSGGDEVNALVDQAAGLKALAWSRCSKVKDRFVNSAGITLVFIPAGAFVMGSPAKPREYGRGVDENQHQVTLTRAFLMGRTEITQKEYMAVMGVNPGVVKGDRLPAENLSWLDAERFCTRLTERERSAGKLPAGWEYRLPTEAEWEYACRAGSAGAYAGAGDLKSLGWFRDNSGGRIQSVAGKQGNAWGLHDMHGNVAEFCRDATSNIPVEYELGPVADPKGMAAASRFRVVRGGNAGALAQHCRSASRRLPFNVAHDVAYPQIGLRIVCVPVATP
ncbi:MAG: hypothetical protein RL095_2442 [Verrucomicrobiota bacterium]|jgi:formylglycine-generating enzyme required for sulfatase activity